MFLGDHTSRDEPGYVRVVGDVLARFHPNLGLTLISAGAHGQTARGIGSSALINILASSRPDWLVIGVGLSDALREPALLPMLVQYRRRQMLEEDTVETPFGPEYPALGVRVPGPVHDSGTQPQPELERLENFRSELRSALTSLTGAGLASILLTTVVVGDDLLYPLNPVLKMYSRVIREVAAQQESPLVDVDQAFRSVMDRAAQYKQKVALANTEGSLTPQGRALLARTFLNRVGLLPQPGFRPLR